MPSVSNTNIGDALKALPTGAQAPFWTGTTDAFLSTLVTTALALAVIIALILIIVGSIRWTLSRGDKDAISSAQKTITAAIIGLVIALSAWAILYLIGGLFGLKKWTRIGGLTSTGGGSGGGSGTSTCQTTCNTTTCQSGASEGFCFNNCRCLCPSGSPTPVSLPIPWCDRDGNTYDCQGGRHKIKNGCS